MLHEGKRCRKRSMKEGGVERAPWRVSWDPRDPRYPHPHDAMKLMIPWSGQRTKLTKLRRGYAASYLICSTRAHVFAHRCRLPLCHAAATPPDNHCC